MREHVSGASTTRESEVVGTALVIKLSSAVIDLAPVLGAHPIGIICTGGGQRETQKWPRRRQTFVSKRRLSNRAASRRPAASKPRRRAHESSVVPDSTGRRKLPFERTSGVYCRDCNHRDKETAAKEKGCTDAITPPYCPSYHSDLRTPPCPHVLSPNPSDEDLIAMQMCRDELNSIRMRIVLTEQAISRQDIALKNCVRPDSANEAKEARYMKTQLQLALNLQYDRLAEVEENLQGQEGLW